VPGEGKRYLNILRTLMIVTCIWEFAARMANQRLLEPSASISIELHGVDGRELTYMTPKYGLDGRYWGRNESIQIDRSFSADQLRARPRELALEACLEIFSSFGRANPPRTLFAEEQARILR
jgi:hypothetical protein